MIEVLYGQDMAVAQFVAGLLREPKGAEDFIPCTALGIVKDGELIGGVIYNNYHGHDIQMTIASTDKRWATRHTLLHLLGYPFNQLNCKRITAVSARRNKVARDMLLRLGFSLEGVVRKGMDGIQDAMIYGMLKHECKWIGSKNNG